MLAMFENLGGSELLIVMAAALLVFGKRLPQVAGDAAKQLVKLRKSLDEAWRDTGMQQEILNVKRDLENAIPRDLSIGEMARIASAEMDKRVRAIEEAAKAAPDPPAATAALPPPQKPAEAPKSTTVDS
jgi:Sec-independent protein translocase protein TatA